MFYPRGEAVAARAAGLAGTAYVLSTLSGTPLEEVKAATSGPCWYQLYLCGGRDDSTQRPRARKAAGFTALVVTIDTPVAGPAREGPAQRREGAPGRQPARRVPLRLAVRGAAALARGLPRRRRAHEVPERRAARRSHAVRRRRARRSSESVVCWDDLRWLREAWRGPIVVKGVHTADDARRAVDAGASAVVVSNHGGRQLDGVAADAARAARGGGGGGQPDRGAARRRHPPR